MSESAVQPISFMKKRWPRVIAALVLFTVVFLLALPFAVKYSLEKWLISNGAQSAKVSGVKLNLFAGTVSVAGLEVKVDDQVVLADNDVAIDIGLTSLFKKEGHLEKGVLSGLILDVEILEDGSVRIGSITTSPGNSPDDEKTDKKELSWVIRASHVELKNCQVRFSTPNLKENVFVEKALLTRLVTGSSKLPAHLSLQGRINKAPLTLELDKIDLSGGIDISGYIKLGDCRLDDLQGVLQEALTPFSGVLALDGKITASRLNGGDLAGSFNGSIRIAEADIGNAAFTAAGTLLSYTGAIRYEQDKINDILVDVNGLLQGDGINLTVPATELGLREKQLRLEGKTQVVVSNGVSVVTDASLGLREFSMDLPAMEIRHSGLDWQGHVEYDLITDEDSQTVSADGALEFRQPFFSLGSKDAPLRTESGLLAWQGKVELDIGGADALTTILADGILNGKGYQLTMPDLAVKDDSLISDGRTEVRLDSGVTVAHDSRKLELKDVSVTAAGTSTGSSRLSWQGKVDYTMAGNGSAVDLDGILEGKLLDVQIPEIMQFANKDISLTGKTGVTISPKLTVVHAGELLLGPINFSNQALKLSGGSLTWKGKTGYQLDPQTVTLDGRLEAASIESLLSAAEMKIRLEKISTNPDKISLQLGEQIQLTGGAAVQADTLTIARGEVPLLKLGQAAVQGLTGSDQGVEVKEIAFSELQLPASADQPYGVSVPAISLTGLASPDFSSASLAELKISQPTVLDSADKTMLAKVEQISGKGLRVDQQANISLQSAAAVKGKFLKKPGRKNKPQLTLSRLQLQDIRWSVKKGLYCNRVELQDLLASYIREKSADSAGKQPDPKKEAKEKKKGAGPALQINSIAITGNSGFQYVDRATSVLFKTSLALEKVQVKDINSAKPDKPLTFILKGSFDQHAPLEISGSAAPFAEKLAVDSKIHLRNYNLQSLSPYVIDAIGTKFVDGQMNLISELKINGDEMDLQNNLVFNKIKAKTVREELLAKLNNELPVSLDMALSMLRDKQGNVKLSVPVTGKLAHLSVNPTDIIVTALSKAIVETVTPYLAYTVLGPAGALIYAGMKIGEELIDTSLPGIEFARGESELTDEHIKTLKQVGKHIKKDKKQDYSVCSRVSVWELAGDIEHSNVNQQKILNDKAARKKMMDLAEKRAQNVWDYLHRHYWIGKDRLLICSPTVDFSKEVTSGTVNFRK
jgi:hypothetical protein